MKRFCTGGRNSRTLWARTLALACAAALSLTMVPGAAAAKIGNGVTPTFDEAYYATLDYYGNLTNGSVVKSYALNGADKLTDYGTYDSVNNLTDGTKPVTAGGATTFDFGKNAPDHFYFEGKTSQPFTALPWTISMSYKLNGVPTKAEELAGKTGVVQINLDIVPNTAASDYSKNNYTLEAMALFNQDDILSLKAEGAQVQLVGNLRMVLFVVLPGEEQHFTIEVGADSFQFDGITYLMVPATLKQLDQIADLKDKKADIESDYDKLDGSLDTFLNSLDNMTGSLRDTARGLDELNEARGTISAGKGAVYGEADKVIGDLGSLNASLATLPGHLDAASQAVTDVSDDLTAVTKSAVSLKDQISDTRKYLGYLQDDMKDVKKLTGTTDDDGDLQEDLEKMGQHADSLRSSITALRSSMKDLDIQLHGDWVTVNGLTPDELRANTEQAKGLHNTYEAVGQGKELDLTGFIEATLIIQETNTKGSALTADELTAIHTQAQGLATLAGLASAPSQEQAANWGKAQIFKAVYGTVCGAGTMSEEQFITGVQMMQDVNSTGSNLSEVLGNKKTYAANAQQLEKLRALSASNTGDGLLANLSDLCSVMGSDGLSKDLTKLSRLAGDTMDDLDSLIDVADQALKTSSTLLDQVQALDDTVNRYVPDLKATLEDTKTIVSSLTSTVSDTRGFLSSFEALAKKSGAQLDSGTKKTLSGLSSTLRKAAASIDTTDDIRSAKNNISSIIRDEWNDHTGDVDNLLNMDSTAQAVSLTSQQNGSPQSVQILIRSQEIKLPDEDTAAQKEKAADQGTFWSRVANLFKHIGQAITGIFRH
ncbi:MAG: hypothetical protein LKJ80_00645 [Oscillibacter sp.]|jgi:putative membrane protein|nr:hypothetical protein [Oscillibacter sp.]